jgi:hypothetical protein
MAVPKVFLKAISWSYKVQYDVTCNLVDPSLVILQNSLFEENFPEAVTGLSCWLSKGRIFLTLKK